MEAMKALLRTLLLWFLLAGVPVQGFATTTMLLCGAGPAAAMAAVVPHHATHHATDRATVPQAGGRHDHAAMLAARHGHAAADGPAAGHGQPPHADILQADMSQADAPHADMPHAGTSHADHVKCASAGACCTGAPLVPSLPAAPPLQDGRCATVPFVATAPAAVHLAGPERPPKFSTA